MGKYIHPSSQQYFAFNIWSIETAKAIIDAASECSRDVILQTSMKAFERVEKKELRAFVTSYSKKKNIHAYLHLDHCRKMDYIKEAIENRWDSVMADASDRSLEENICITNEVCAAAHKNSVLVEAEIGEICGAEDEISATEDGIAETADIERFLQNVEADMFAAAVGTVHGLYKGGPDIHYDIIEKAALLTDIPMVIHGGTGLEEQTLLRLLSYGNIKKINISTDVKQAYRQGIEDGIGKGYLEKYGFDPLKIEQRIHDSIKNMALDKLKLLKKV
ncbi:MAG: class II fructose-bisphosphate aldolase [Ruminococcus flavefaciens]|nr:class II fructose-bisphosphate aldolase [Ruminococcus flavefaciens]